MTESIPKGDQNVKANGANSSVGASVHSCICLFHSAHLHFCQARTCGCLMCLQLWEATQPPETCNPFALVTAQFGALKPFCCFGWSTAGQLSLQRLRVCYKTCKQREQFCIACGLQTYSSSRLVTGDVAEEALNNGHLASPLSGCPLRWHSCAQCFKAA